MCIPIMSLETGIKFSLSLCYFILTQCVSHCVSKAVLTQWDPSAIPLERWDHKHISTGLDSVNLIVFTELEFAIDVFT